MTRHRTITPAMRWAQRRNNAKRRIMGLLAQLRGFENDPLLTSVEQRQAHNSAEILDGLLHRWRSRNAQSKKENVR